MIECGRRLCHEQATNLVAVQPSFGSERQVKARYLLCETHAALYAPEGLTFMTGATSAALRLQCVPVDKRINDLLAALTGGMRWATLRDRHGATSAEMNELTAAGVVYVQDGLVRLRA